MRQKESSARRRRTRERGPPWAVRRGIHRRVLDIQALLSSIVEFHAIVSVHLFWPDQSDAYTTHDRPTDHRPVAGPPVSSVSVNYHEESMGDCRARCLTLDDIHLTVKPGLRASVSPERLLLLTIRNAPQATVADTCSLDSPSHKARRWRFRALVRKRG